MKINSNGQSVDVKDLPDWTEIDWSDQSLFIWHVAVDYESDTSYIMLSNSRDLSDINGKQSKSYKCPFSLAFFFESQMEMAYRYGSQEALKKERSGVEDIAKDGITSHMQYLLKHTLNLEVRKKLNGLPFEEIIEAEA